MKLILLLALATTLGLGITGCGKRDASTTPTPSQATGNATVESMLTAWQQGDKPGAVAQFVATDWSARPLFAPDSSLNLSEEQFVTKIKAMPSEADVQKEKSQMLAQLDKVKRIAVAVAEAGTNAAAKNDLETARKYINSLQQCGEALDSAHSTRLMQLVGQAIKKRAATESTKLPK